MISFEQWFVEKHPEIPLRGALVVLMLAGEGATIPFIARYRKEKTGNLDEVAVERAITAKKYWDDLSARKEFVLNEIESQGKLTEELKSSIENTVEMAILEDLYLPYKKKRKTKATVAKEAGLEPLAEWIWRCGHAEEKSEKTLEEKAVEFVNTEKGVATIEAALGGAQDILVERLSETQDLRQLVRTTILQEGFVSSRKTDKAKANSKFENYFEYDESVKTLILPQNSHRYLAIRRGEAEEELVITIGGKIGDDSLEQKLLSSFEATAGAITASPGQKILKQTSRFALKYHVAPSIAAEVHGELKKVADETAIKVFADNVKTVLMSAPFGAKTVLGVDPGIRTGCKLALVDQSGAFVSSAVISPSSSGDKERTKFLLKELSGKANLKAIAVGNGTAGRETEAFFRQAISELKLALPVVMVSESGASVYSASEVAREEFPDLDLTIRGAISIARRFQDPLAELVKVDPKSIGVGQYQHDVSPAALKNNLERVVESCVNSVGVNLNTASRHLLAFVSGIGPSLARNIVDSRAKRGLFKSRQDLLKVPLFGPKAFEQAAGFLRIPNGENPLDNTGVHPERYAILEEHAKKKGKSLQDLIGQGAKILKEDKELRNEIGEFTFEDIIRELEKPGRDPRDEFTIFEFLKDVHEIKDLKEGMICPGIVTNVTNFGAFVDIGVHQDGLVHISQLRDSFVKDPREVVNPGDKVKVKVLSVNIEKSQIALSMRMDSQPGIVQKMDQTNRGQAHRHSGIPPKERGPREEAFKNTPFAALAVLTGKRNS